MYTLKNLYTHLIQCFQEFYTSDILNFMPPFNEIPTKQFHVLKLELPFK